MHRTPAARRRLHWRIARAAAVLWMSAAAAAPGSAAPLQKAFSQAHSLIHQSLQQYQSGNRGAALNSLKAAHGLMLTQPTQFSAVERKRVTALIDSVALHPPAATGSRPPLEAYRDTLISLDPLQHPPPHRWTPNAPASATRVLRAAWNAVPRLAWVTTNVAQFGHDFRAGANSPQQALLDEKYRWHASSGMSMAGGSGIATHLSQVNIQLINRWLAAPKERRVFVIGARADEPQVELLRQRYPDLVFGFYQDCKPLCRESTIGGLFGSSGSVISIESPDARNSAFIPVEVGLVNAHHGSGRRLWLIDGDEARRVMSNAGTASVATSLVSCSLEAIIHDEAACR